MKEQRKKNEQKGQKKHICLIGMSGVGKSLFGKLLAQDLGLDFIDTDDCIRNHINENLSPYIEKNGEDTFKKIEEQIVLNLNPSKPTVIATGGSVIYSKNSMNALKKHSQIFFLNDSLEHIISRNADYNNRGIILNGTKNLNDLYTQRYPLYKHYADHCINYPKHYSTQIILNLIKEVLK
jgi:shikimate kinase